MREKEEERKQSGEKLFEQRSTVTCDKHEQVTHRLGKDSIRRLWVIAHLPQKLRIFCKLEWILDRLGADMRWLPRPPFQLIVEPRPGDALGVFN